MRLHQQIPCIRVSPKGLAAADFRFPSEIAIWQEFNQRNRPDHALVVGAEVVWLGTHFKSLEEVAVAMKDYTPPRKQEVL